MAGSTGFLIESLPLFDNGPVEGLQHFRTYVKQISRVPPVGAEFLFCRA